MNKEIERKFFVINGEWKKYVTRSYQITQGYFNTKGETSIRARISDIGSYITIKLPKDSAGECLEFEYHIPLEDAKVLIEECYPAMVTKMRHEVDWNGILWEIDVFSGRLSGLIIAEVELNTADQAVDLPPWLGREITDNPRYTNKSLAFM